MFLRTILLATILNGYATFYSQGKMEEVYANRLAWHQVQPCSTCVGMVSMIRFEDIGKQVFIERSDNPGMVEGPFLVVDCAPPWDYVSHESRNHIAEVDYKTALRWKMRGPIDVKLYRDMPRCSRLSRTCDNLDF